MSLAGWNRFWFAPTSTAPVEVFRIVFGVLATAWMLSMAPVIDPFFGPDPAIPRTPVLPPGAWTLFSFAPNEPVAWVLWSLGVVAGVAVTVGLGTRLAAVVLLIVLASIQRQAPTAFNSGDGLIRLLAFYLILMPAGSAASIDRMRAAPDDVWTFPRHAPWALRLVQIQLSVIYLSTVWEKSGGTLWRDGTAVSYALRVLNVNRVQPPAFVTDSVTLVQLMTFGTLALELALGVLVWNRAARPWVLAVGVLLHFSTDVSIMVGFFAFAMLTLYLAFLSPESAERLVDTVRAGVGRWRRANSLTDEVPGGTGRDAPDAAMHTRLP